MRWHSILSEYPIITLKNFFYSRKKFLTQTSPIVFFVNFDTIVIYQKKFWLHHTMKSQQIPWLFGHLPNQVNLHQEYLISSLYHIHDRSADWREFQESNLFNLAKPFFWIIRMPLSNLSLRESGRFSLLFRVHSLICGIVKRLNCLKFLFSPFSLLMTDLFLFVRQFSWC